MEPNQEQVIDQEGSAGTENVMAEQVADQVAETSATQPDISSVATQPPQMSRTQQKRMKAANERFVKDCMAKIEAQKRQSKQFKSTLKDLRSKVGSEIFAEIKKTASSTDETGHTKINYVQIVETCKDLIAATREQRILMGCRSRSTGSVSQRKAHKGRILTQMREDAELQAVLSGSNVAASAE